MHLKCFNPICILNLIIKSELNVHLKKDAKYLKLESKNTES